MSLKLMLAGATLALTAVGAAQAAPARSTALPSQPVPYTMLDAYLKATPKARAAMLANASAPAAQTDASATAGASGASSTSDTSTDASASPAAAVPEAPAAAAAPAAPTGDMPSGPVNPPTATPPATDSSSEGSADGTAAPAKP